MSIDDIRIKSNSEIGSKSSLGTETYMPKKESIIPAVRTQTSEVGPDPRCATETVLLVDDQENVRNIASIALRRRGFTVIEAIDGAMAVGIFDAPAAPKIDALLSDIRMPGAIDGHRLAKLFSAKFPAAPVLLMGGDGENGSRSDSKIYYIAKPFTIHSLAAVVRKAIDMAARRFGE